MQIDPQTSINELHLKIHYKIFMLKKYFKIYVKQTVKWDTVFKRIVFKDIFLSLFYCIKIIVWCLEVKKVSQI